MTNQHPEFDAAPPTNVARGFALYVGVDEATAKAAGTTLADLVNALRAKGQVVAYHDRGDVPSDQSQGWFPFGMTCAKRKLAEAKGEAA